MASFDSHASPCRTTPLSIEPASNNPMNKALDLLTTDSFNQTGDNVQASVAFQLQGQKVSTTW